MLKLLNKELNLSFFVNPFYLYCLAFSLAIFVYLWGWSNIFPSLSAGLLIFFGLSFILFILAGRFYGIKGTILNFFPKHFRYFNDIIFCSILIIGLVNFSIMGYLPIIGRSDTYLEYGVPVLDPVFNTLCIFFSVFFFQSYLESKTKRYLIYILIILILQLLIFRRSTIIWIIVSSSFLFILYTKRIKLWFMLAVAFSIPLFSYCFGVYGNVRSDLTKSIVLDDLGASDTFKRSGISYNHYLTYLYISSPLANLQKNIDRSDKFFNNKDLNSFFFYSLIPLSITLRCEEQLKLSRPECKLITHELIVGSFFMVAYYTMGWGGMIFMVLLLLLFIQICVSLIRKLNTFSAVTISLLSTTVLLLTFSNFLNHLDVFIMLFIYPVLFHFIVTSSKNQQVKA